MGYTQIVSETKTCTLMLASSYKISTTGYAPPTKL